MRQTDTDRTSLAGRIDSLEAFLESLKTDTDAALATLAGSAAPEHVRGQILLLIDADRYEEAAALVRDIAPHARWADLATFAYAVVGQMSEAQALLEWSRTQDDALLARRAAMALAEGVLTHVQSVQPDMLKTARLGAPTAAASTLQTAADALSPLLLIPKANGRIQTKSEREAVELATRICALQGDLGSLLELAPLLAQETPIPLVLAQLTVAHLVDAPDDIVTRLRTEYRESFQAHLLACIIEGEVLHRYADAFSSAQALLPHASDAADKAEAVKVLFHAAQHLDSDALSQAHAVARAHLSDAHPLVQYIQVLSSIHNGAIDEARAILEHTPRDEDPTWLQLYAQCLELAGNRDEALKLLLRAADLLPHPGVLQRAADLAVLHSRPETAVTALQRAVALSPDDGDLHHDLALTYMRLSAFDKAAAQFRLLRRQYPNIPGFGVNEAICLARGNQLDESLSVYEDTLKEHPGHLPAVIGRATVLTALGRPTDAFTSLDSQRESFSDSPVFLAALMRAAYAVGKDEAADAALQQLVALGAQDDSVADILKPVALDEVLRRAAEYQDRTLLIARTYVSGRVPWVMAEELANRGPCFGWERRTQPLKWCAEDVQSHGSYAVYATNGFSVILRGNSKAVTSIAAAPQGTPIVADVSALITLHRLGVLERVAEYFGRIVLPATYRELRMKEGVLLAAHQSSRRTELLKIRELIDARSIALTRPGERQDHAIAVDEDSPTGTHRTSLVEIARTLLAADKIDADTHRKLLAARATASTHDDHESIRAGAHLNVALDALRTIARVGALDAFAEHFRVNLAEEEYDALIAELRVFTAQDEVAAWQAELWALVTRRREVEFSPFAAKNGGEEHDTIAFDAVHLAEQLSLRLLADDRMCQAVVLNERLSDPSAAFGTDRVVVAMGYTGAIPMSQVVSSLRQLMDWRYRFIVPPAECLKLVLDAAARPGLGPHLRAIAKYQHDCMRDPGLFRGKEESEPPMPMAVRLFQEWMDVWGLLLSAVWSDANYSVEDAGYATECIIGECLPSSPHMLASTEVEARVLQVLPELFLGKLLLQLAVLKDTERANRAMRVAATAFGMDEHNYMRLITRTINAL